MKNKLLGELAVCGFNAVKALCLAHPERIQRLFFNAKRSRDFGDACKLLSREKRTYRLVEDEELVRLAKSEHHQGVVAMIEIPAIPELDAAKVDEWIDGKRAVVILENLGNANNLGAIVRSAAFFGLADILLLDMKGQTEISTSAYRIAEGGMEYVNLYRCKDLAAAVSCKAFSLIGTDHAGKKAIGDPGALPLGSNAFGIVFGNEEDGLSPQTRKLCSSLVRIPGTGSIESLNVAQAVTVFLSRL
jgi:TrmH RNA methyltransferase